MGCGQQIPTGLLNNADSFTVASFRSGKVLFLEAILKNWNVLLDFYNLGIFVRYLNEMLQFYIFR